MNQRTDPDTDRERVNPPTVLNAAIACNAITNFQFLPLAKIITDALQRFNRVRSNPRLLFLYVFCFALLGRKFYTLFPD